MPGHDSPVAARPRLIWHVPAVLWMPEIYCGFLTAFQHNLPLICTRALDLPHACTGFRTYNLLGSVNETRSGANKGGNIPPWSEVVKVMAQVSSAREINSWIGHLGCILHPQHMISCCFTLCTTKPFVSGLHPLVFSSLSCLSNYATAFMRLLRMIQVEVRTSACESSCFDRCLNQGLEQAWELH